MSLARVAQALPPNFRIMFADVGSAGGIHRRWKPVRGHVQALLFDPLDPQPDDDANRYFPFALAEQAGTATLNVTRRISMTSVLQPNAPLLARFWDKPDHTRIERTISVQTDTLDHLMAQGGIAVDVMKIDVQGFERSILAGAEETLERSLFLAEIELSFIDRYSGLTRFEDVVRHMRQKGLELVDIGRIKRYRYRNAMGIVNPGLGMGDRAGRVAFCDATFMLNDDLLRERILAGGGGNGTDLGLKAIIALLVHGKADVAAWLFDACADTLPDRARAALQKYLVGLGGRHFGRRGWHKALDYLARKV
ncbi:FkbM family methyltransferase [Sphingobium fontiphilum]|uniref:FkbM family methyltransferase n=1 Tax=Sphingobium fontiphilum TaxID=944425 RepID=A0A7W6GLW7_9SPHN|nr:FkbM family methyltransferase [Sphingobium fontiphilum]MBB3980596.1 FkbM family methyltransferase [Sphingobium fontiphilum]